MTLYRIVLATLIFGSIASYPAQTTQEFSKAGDYVSVASGLMHHLPVLTENNFNISREFTNDRDFSLIWYRLYDKNFGLQMKYEYVTQSIKYGYTRPSGWLVSYESFAAFRRRYSVTTAICYNLMASKKLNMIVSIGPQFHLNKRSFYNQFSNIVYSGGVSSRGIRQFGYGFNCGLKLLYKISDKISLFINPFYQRGFVKLSETIVGDGTKTSTLSYFGTGPGYLFGLTFGPIKFFR